MIAAKTKRWIVACAASAGYVVVALWVYDALPFANIPAEWDSVWPDRPAAVITWWHLLNITGAVLSALPIAVLMHLLLGKIQPALALLVATPAAVYAIGSSLVAYPEAFPMHPFAATMDALVLSASLLVAIPLLTTACSRVSQRKGIDGSASV